MKMKNLLMIAIATFGLAAISMAQVPSYVPTNGLVGWWPFTGNANDESSNGNNGTVNGATLTTDRNGITNSAFTFDGVNDNINPLQNNLPLGTTARTISVWFQRIGTGGCLFSYGSANTSNAYMIAIGANIIANQGWTSPDFGVYPIIDNLWHNVVCTFDGLNATIYFDNSNLGNTPMTGLNTIGGSFYFGTRVLNDMDFFNGNIDDIGIWNRVLTQQEITNLYNAANCTNNTAITPQINSLTTGSTATFIASTTDPTPTYVWQSDLGQGFQTLNNFGNYSGVNTASLNVTNVQLSEHNQPIRVISTSGNCIDTSNVAVINILDTCITNVTIYDTILTTVTDTLIINATITGLNPPSNQNTLKIFPNPANTHITIDYGNFSSMNGYTLKIVNATGQTVFTTFINQQNSYIDLSTWTGNGIYYVQLIDTQNNTIENRKIVIH